uniref:Uncharacterized protein n=1 Tax=Schizaphis graminum TaxID=13262 RepID=A0A2S2NL35_SCHGA
MDTIKMYFTQSNVFNKSMDENYESSGSSTIIYNKTQDEDMIISSFSESAVDKKCIQYTNKHFLHKIKSLEEENDRLLSIIENKNIIKNDSLKCNCNYNNNIPDFANKKILQLTEKVNELMSELQIIKSSASGDYKTKIPQK